MKKPKAIFISAHLPTLNIPVAGQKIAFSNLKTLCQKYDVILISFINDIEKKYFDPSLYKMCFKTHFIRIRQSDRIKNIFFNLAEPIRVSPRNIKKIRILIKEYIHHYTVKLFHAEYTASMSYVNLFDDKIYKEVVEHDIVYQSFERYCKNKTMPYKLLYCMETKRQKKWEITKLMQFDSIIVLNEKDKLLLQNENIKNVTIAFPKVDDWCYSITRNNIEPYSILFLGAMNRFENQDAIIWFVKNMFPEIIKIYPNTKLYIVGGNPSNKIIGLQSENIKVTGFVDSLKIFFEKAHIAIVPLRYGAGVKIKTLETLAAKIPTISTTVGAEGIPSDNNLLVCDTETLFVKKINSIFEEYMKKGNT